ncbi:MAG: hypothetical protein J6Y84_02775 [Bacteroidaceae bacterium]|nr:hypothetical protein [Bacteroidaceae bacterium]
MKKKTIAFTILALVASSLFAQKFALQGAKELLLKTKDLKITEQVTQQLRDSNDSLCTAEIIAFELPFSRRDVFQKVQQEFSNELPHSSGGYSRIADWDAESRLLTEGVQRIQMYYAEGREPILTEENSNFVCIRHNLPNPKYRTVVCIEWCNEKSGQKLQGEIISIQGPIDASVYGPSLKYSGSVSYPFGTVIKMRKGEKDPFDYFKELKPQDFKPLDIISRLPGIYQYTADEKMREAIISAFNSQVSGFLHNPSRDNEDMKELLQIMKEMPDYGVAVYKAKTSAEGEEVWEPKLLTFDEAIDKYDSFKVFCMSWCDKESPEAKAFGEETKNGLLQIFLDR